MRSVFLQEDFFFSQEVVTVVIVTGKILVFWIGVWWLLAKW